MTFFYGECVKYLLINVPLNNQTLIDVKYLHPNMKSKIGASKVQPNSNVFELKDQVKLEFSAFQLEANVPEI